MDFLPITVGSQGVAKAVEVQRTPEPLLLTIEDTAHRLAVGTTTVKKLIRTGELGSVKIGASRRVTRIALERYINSLG